MCNEDILIGELLNLDNNVHVAAVLQANYPSYNNTEIESVY